MEKVREQEMLEAFRKQVAAVLARPEIFNQPGTKVGFESEIGLYHAKLSAKALRSIRNKIVKAISASHELGAFQVEITTPAIDITETGIKGLRDVYEAIWGNLLMNAHNYGVQVIRAGTLPHLAGINPTRTLRKKKYKQVPDYQNANRRKNVDTKFGKTTKVEVGDASIISLFQAFQPNVQAKSLQHGIEMMNYSFMFSPMLVAISANARWLAGVDTEHQDCRTLVWEISHDTRTEAEYEQGLRLRVGLPEDYFPDSESYFRRMERFPFILYKPKAALQVAVGLSWLDARMKIIGNSAVVELRSLSTQPTIADEIALTLMYLGLLRYAEEAAMPLMPIWQVAYNRQSAMADGLEGTMYDYCGHLFPTRMVVAEALACASKGLTSLGLCEEAAQYMCLLKQRLIEGTPSVKVSSLLNTAIASKCELMNAFSLAGMIH